MSPWLARPIGGCASPSPRPRDFGVLGDCRAARRQPDMTHRLLGNGARRRGRVNNLVFVAMPSTSCSASRRASSVLARSRSCTCCARSRTWSTCTSYQSPERCHVSRGEGNTASSPKRDMTRSCSQVSRLLDELLAILSKVAAIYVQRFNAPETLRAARYRRPHGRFSRNLAKDHDLDGSPISPSR